MNFELGHKVNVVAVQQGFHIGIQRQIGNRTSHFFVVFDRERAVKGEKSGRQVNGCLDNLPKKRKKDIISHAGCIGHGHGYIAAIMILIGDFDTRR